EYVFFERVRNSLLKIKLHMALPVNGLQICFFAHPQPVTQSIISQMGTSPHGERVIIGVESNETVIFNFEQMFGNSLAPNNSFSICEFVQRLHSGQFHYFHRLATLIKQHQLAGHSSKKVPVLLQSNRNYSC